MTITKEGNLASFYTVNKAFIKHLKVYFSPKQVGTGDPSPSNVREISGWNGVQFYRTKRNMVQVTGYGVKGTFTGELGNSVGTTINNANYNLPDTPLIVTQSQTPNTNTKQAFQNGFITIFVNNLIFNQYYDISFRITDIKSNPLNAEFRDLALLLNGNAWYYCSQVIDDTIIFKNIRWKRYSDDPSNSNYNNSYFEIRICGMSFTLSEFMVTPANTNNGIFEPYSGSASIIDWTNEVGTVYGGYVDLVTGELVQEWSHVILNGAQQISLANWRPAEGSSAWGYGSIFGIDKTSKTNTNCIYCNKLKTVSYDTIYNGLTSAVISGQDGSYNWHLFIRYPDATLTTKEAINTFLTSNPLDVVYKLETPITHQLTPTQLSTLIGRNNIWSNADRVEVEYDLAESNDELYRRRNILLRSAPHIETVSGNIAHFETDITAPIKSAKISFSPVQEGSGDPSPENVRAINGWNNIQVTACGKNMLQSWRSIYGNIRTNGETDANGISITHLDNGFEVTGTASKTGSSHFNGASTLSQLNSYNAPPLQKNQTYIISCNKTSLIGCQGGAIAEGWSGWIWLGHAFTMPNDGKVWLYSGLGVTEGVTYNESITNIQLEYGSISTEYESFHGTIIPIDWQTAAGTIYGGYIDLITGEVWKTWDIFMPNENDYMFKYSNNDFMQIRLAGGDAPRIKTRNSAYCSHYKMEMNPNIYGLTGVDYVNTTCQLIVQNGENGYFDTLEEFRAWLVEQRENGTPFYIVYEKDVPELVATITPFAFNSLRRTNNIWSNANGPVEIKYWTH